MEEAKTMKTPMSSSIKLDKDEKVQLHLRALRALVGFHYLLFGFIFFSDFIFSFSAFLMAPRRETTTSRAQAKRPVEPSLHEQIEARRKVRYDMTLFSFVEEYQRYKQKFSQRKVVPGRRSIMSIVRGVEIRLSPESIWHIFDILSVGLWVRLGDGQTIGTQPDHDQPCPSSHDLLHPIAARVFDDDAYDILLLRRPPMALGLGELSDLQHKSGTGTNASRSRGRGRDQRDRG
ncbi:hypothetical protein CK203_096313 [Vitis vinifera]|uniref:Uncharacterized protein n=1 Tax=Vitis vinifera TaxID=29760 RepID=A0A438FC74_VITVI|nr:hypothetical protein CK203_096313 [Vitis vinifera]